MKHRVTDAVVVGDCIIDEMHGPDGRVSSHPGGAALNLASGLARLGVATGLVTRFGQDRNGFVLARHLREEGLRFFNPPGVDPTGVAYSSRVDGEPTYGFNAAMFRRRIPFTDEILKACARARAVAVNSFPFDDPAQARSLCRALGMAAEFAVVDPNPRPDLVRDVAAYRAGVDLSFASSRLVKVSDEDVALLYGEQDGEAVLGHLFASGAQAVLLTHGPGGASLFAKAGEAVRVPVPPMPGPVVDTMGAGDAALASVVASLLREGWPASAGDWRRHLVDAMMVAASTCRSPGGAMALPGP